MVGRASCIARRFERCNGVLHLTVEAFYVGTRRLIASVLAQKEHMQHAASQFAPRADQTMSSARDEIMQTSRSVTLVNSDSTASAIPAVDTSWIGSKDC